MSHIPPPEDRQELFTRLLVANQNRLFAFIFTLIQDRTAANDVLQEVSVVLWKKFEHFDPETDFAAWAMSVARYSVLEWRRAQKRNPMILDEELLAKLADEAVSVSCEQDERIETLHRCIEGLSPAQRNLLVRRYVHNTSVVDIATHENHTRMAVYKRLNKIHAILLECIRRRLAMEGSE